jgi:hypothetical protein
MISSVTRQDPLLPRVRLMAPRITPEFFASEAKRLLQLASLTIDHESRMNLVELANRYQRMAANLERERAEAANTRDYGSS